MTDPTDAELVAQLREGSRQAAGLLAERYLRAMRAVALSVLHDIHAAEDVCQDAFVHAIERIDDCREPERFAGWLLTMVRNRSRNRLRDGKAGTHRAIDDRLPGAREGSPELRTERSEIRDRIVTALATLTEERRAVVLLHDLEGWTHREIAERLDLAQGTVRSHLHYARKHLRPLLRDLMEDPND